MRQQSTVTKSDLLPIRHLGSCDSRRIPSRTSQISFHPATGTWWKRAIIAAPAAVRSEIAVVEDKKSPIQKKPVDPVRLFVGLPLDAVSDRKTVNHAKAIAAGLRALKLLGAHGVELPVHWAVAQPESPENADWSAYLAVALAARDAGLRVRVSLRLDGTLPKWVERIAASDSDLLFTDRSGRRYPGCLSFAADELPVLDGATPMNAFESFFLSFRSAFGDLIGPTVTDITVGLGPGGELRYPSFPSGSKNRPFTGVGEFQCYDKYMLAALKKQAEAAGNPLWGLTGPHDAPEYNQTPDSGFFKEHGGSWETGYGNFFLSWYSGQIIDHADRVLSLASKVFGELPVRLSGKVPLIHCWHNTRSRAAQLTAGFYNANGRDGYDAVAKVFARNSCTMVVPGIDLADQDQPQWVQSSPESLLLQIMKACERHGVRVAGENSWPPVPSGAPAAGFEKIKKNLLGSVMDSLTYQRMGAYFFSPEHWPRFTEFVRSLALPELDSDDLLASEEEERVSLPLESIQGKAREMQAV